ncbi:Meiotic Sister-Chromatid recombination aldehyde dehydrogenase [Exophiala dermatitidis]|uniref:aldehyde dehydrogenase (NAD(+)) n=1 Tax=Exophiala dermatitidis TaxID=5970 RepID=A0AAN6IV94_EXODE|nr:Meiotic Sister-Chromatid recombination aldehyde dehydrogenase [Exophiala dermatitidis]KAJ4563442.1 Meiotic Sister-Chromatid recombination aldehyde dehydrogenase [Exophiala dermatitidis]KAJ4622108.1 Meiotic Sister-Chromatid recombination aldehyde dehydrogenase [Exophiala dermatitidis]KAJ4657771.1 Meiotic Sister-Chromatid recombination aldehyde dehydrogenase [Exophiala dermatitidis]KAJ8991483.1 Meiotic Sister-Chromatid recombination aldehyde dehydrogenase [Exophiala dermatitidis]
MGRVFYRGLEMQNIFIKLAVSISAGFDARLLSGAVLSILLVFVLGRVFHGRNERAVPYTVSIPPQLDDNYEWKSEEIDQPRQDVSEVRNGYIYPRCPADGRSLGDPIAPATPSSVDRAISAAARAQIPWSQTTFSERRRVLSTLLQHVLDHQEEIVTACCLDSGKTKIDACFGEILVTVEKLQWTIKHGEKALSPSRRPTNLLMCYKANTVVYEPLGVVAACVSWNYPFHNFISPVISALFAGNAIAVKPSEQTCWSSLYFTDLIRGGLRACGHDPDLVQNVICLPEVADYLTSHPGLSHITFIGSREVAHKVCTSAAKALTPVTVELGGKDPAIVLDDSKTIKKLDDVTAVLMRGVFQSAGQNCIGTERIIALPGVHDKILSNVLPKIQSLRLGSVLLSAKDSPPDMGAMISSRNFQRLEGLIEAAVAQGAKLHCGGKRHIHPKYPNGTYFQPTLLSNVTVDMEIAQQELFAPVFVLMKAHTVDEVIAMANSTPYALGASVFGHDRFNVAKCVAGIKAGMVAVNDFGAYYACSMPFGGVKGSGYGRFGGEEGLRALSNVKSICVDASWAMLLGISTAIPPKLQYPVSKDGWDICKGVVGTGYALGWRRWIANVVGLVAALLRRDADVGKQKDA